MLKFNKLLAVDKNIAECIQVTFDHNYIVQSFGNYLTSRSLKGLHSFKRNSPRSPHRISHNVRGDHLREAQNFCVRSSSLFFGAHSFPSLVRRLKPDRDVSKMRRKLTSSSRSRGESPTGGQRRRHRRETPAKLAVFASVSDKKMKMRSRDISVASEMMRTYAHTRVFVT